MYTAVLICIRSSIGVAVSLALGYLSVLVSVLVLDTILFSFPSLSLSGVIVNVGWFTFIGLTAATGARVGWIGDDSPRGIDWALTAVALLGGLSGSWAGMLYSTLVNAGNVFTDNPVTGAAVFTSALAANGCTTALAVRRLAG